MLETIRDYSTMNSIMLKWGFELTFDNGIYFLPGKSYTFDLTNVDDKEDYMFRRIIQINTDNSFKIGYNNHVDEINALLTKTKI